MKAHKNKIPLWLLLAAASSAAAESVDDGDGVAAMLAELTELATRSRLNVDYVPGSMDILLGGDLLARGARTVWDALAFAPGVVAVIDQLGHRRVTVRGLGSIGDNWSSGYIKLLLNGIPQNSDEKGLAEAIYHLPVAQVDRIEVIRGPGSAIHGEHAIAGVLNVITRSEESQVFAFGGSHDSWGGGATLVNTQGPVRWSLNVGGAESAGAEVTTGRDALYQQGFGDASYAPGPTNERLADQHAIARLEWAGLTLTGQWAKVRSGDYFGVNYFLAPDSDRLVEAVTQQQLEARYRWNLPSGRFELFLGEQGYRVQKDQLFAAPAVYYGAEGEDVRVDLDYEERRRYWGGEWSLKAADHQLLVGASQARTDVLQGAQSFNLLFDPATGFQIPPGQIEYGYPVPAGTTREIESVVFQDEYRATEMFSLTTGVRYDYYSGVGANWSPRIAGVWRIGEADAFKAQWARAFRPPTLSELTAGIPGIRPVTIDTAELGYVRKGPRGEWRATAAYSELHDVIVFDPHPAYFYSNAQSARSENVELEGRLRPTLDLRLAASVAYANNEVAGSGEPIPGSSRWVGRASAGWNNGPWVLDLEYQAVSGFARQPADPREEAEGYGTVDFTATMHVASGISLRAGIANLFDSDVRYPAFLADDPNLGAVVSYPGDLPRPGRSWWAEVSARF